MIVYKITNKVNGKIYIGLTTLTLEQRWKNHLKSYKHTQYAIHRALRKYGIESFSIEEIDHAETLSQLISKEAGYIKQLNSMNPKIGYNMLRQEGRTKFITEEMRKKMSSSQKKRIAKLTKVEKEKIYQKSSISKQGKKRSYHQGFLGVYKDRRCIAYAIEIQKDGERLRKSFTSEKEAAEAYDKLALHLYGNEARLNFDRNNYTSVNLQEYYSWFKQYERPRGNPKRRTVKTI